MKLGGIIGNICPTSYANSVGTTYCSAGQCMVSGVFCAGARFKGLMLFVQVFLCYWIRILGSSWWLCGHHDRPVQLVSGVAEWRRTRTP